MNSCEGGVAPLPIPAYLSFIPAKSDFSVPVTAQLSLKELGLLDTIVNLLGGKKYQIQYAGFVRIAVHGVTIKVPFTYQEEIRLRL